jgi:hypothetical protein
MMIHFRTALAERFFSEMIRRATSEMRPPFQRRLLRISDCFIILFYFSEMQTVEVLAGSLLSILNGDSIYSPELFSSVTGAN